MFQGAVIMKKENIYKNSHLFRNTRIYNKKL
jgi:hypothetical protein